MVGDGVIFDPTINLHFDYSPSTDRSQGGPIIEREFITMAVAKLAEVQWILLLITKTTMYRFHGRLVKLSVHTLRCLYSGFSKWMVGCY